jgi:hypothetical protein
MTPHTLHNAVLVPHAPWTQLHRRLRCLIVRRTSPTIGAAGQQARRIFQEDRSPTGAERKPRHPRLNPPRDALGDFLEDPLVAVRIREGRLAHI